MTLLPAKAFLLAAGVGSRLGELTQKTPKCLLPVAGEPALHWWLKALSDLGVTEVLVNTHHHSEQVEAFLAGRRYGARVRTAREPVLLGSGGTLAQNAGFVAGEPAYWICYADTLIAAPLGPLPRLHEERRSDLTFGLFRSPEPKTCGIAVLSPQGKVLSFEEKPKQPKGDLAAAGVYVAGPRLLETLAGLDAAPRPLDLGGSVFPALLDNAFGLLLEGPVLDIGTPERYELAQKEWRR